MGLWRCYVISSLPSLDIGRWTRTRFYFRLELRGKLFRLFSLFFNRCKHDTFEDLLVRCSPAVISYLCNRNYYSHRLFWFNFAANHTRPEVYCLIDCIVPTNFFLMRIQFHPFFCRKIRVPSKNTFIC